MRFYPCYAFDLDGTLYRGSQVVPGAPEAIRAIRDRGAQVLFVTNNSGMTRADYVSKLASMAIDATPDEVITSGSAAGSYVLRQKIQKVFVVGEPGLVMTLRELGLTVVNAGPDGLIHLDTDGAQAVISGICRAALSYDLLDAAMQVAMRTGQYIACNADLTYPVEDGVFRPGSGAIVAALEACSGVQATVVGKPAPDMLIDALKGLNIDSKDTLMVGDRMDTDIACGKAAGTDTGLGLTGVSQSIPAGQWCLDSVKDLV